MADFRVEFTDGVTVEPWEDPLLGNVPSRLNPRPEQGHRRHVGAIGVEVELSAIVGGVLAPLDGALGGRLFSCFPVEWPSVVMPAVSSPGGQSSVQRFTPAANGHYTLRILRDGGGSVFFHVDVE